VATHGDLVVQRDAGRPSGRLLRQGDMDASYVDLADARHLEFDYLRRMRDIAELCGARRILHVGGAGCTLARALADADPGLRQEVAEVDGAVLDVAREHLGLRRMPGMRVRCREGRSAVAARADASTDMVLYDAFVGARVPRHLMTVEALADVVRILGPTGAVAVNVVDSAPQDDTRAIAAGLKAVFRTVAALAPGPVLRGRRNGNIILVAGSGALPLERLRARAAADPSPAAVLEPAEIDGLIAGLTPWTDPAPDVS
jgi:spermidine synthase